jgi:hypothetical protein
MGYLMEQLRLIVAFEFEVELFSFFYANVISNRGSRGGDNRGLVNIGFSNTSNPNRRPVTVEINRQVRRAHNSRTHRGGS